MLHHGLCCAKPAADCFIKKAFLAESFSLLIKITLELVLYKLNLFHAFASHGFADFGFQLFL